MIVRVKVEVEHLGGKVEVAEVVELNDDAKEGAVARSLDAAAKRATIRAKAAAVGG